jgi:hypothetical protein
VKSLSYPLTDPWQFDILLVLGPASRGNGCNSINWRQFITLLGGAAALRREGSKGAHPAHRSADR